MFQSNTDYYKHTIKLQKYNILSKLGNLLQIFGLISSTRLLNYFI